MDCTLKRFWVIAFDYCESLGGLGDVKESFDTLDEAAKAAQVWDIYDVCFVYDRVDNKTYDLEN